MNSLKNKVSSDTTHLAWLWEGEFRCQHPTATHRRNQDIGLSYNLPHKFDARFHVGNHRSQEHGVGRDQGDACMANKICMECR